MTYITRAEYARRLKEFVDSHPDTKSTGYYGYMAHTHKLKAEFNKKLAAEGTKIDPLSLTPDAYTARLNAFLRAKHCFGFTALFKRQAMIAEFDEIIAKQGFYVEGMDLRRMLKGR